MAKTKITCTVPTQYEVYSLLAISRGEISKNPDGSFSWVAQFSTKKAAKAYLATIARKLSDSRQHEAEMIREIAVYDQLTYDAAVAIIENAKQ
jgi:hypothetical protein